METTPNKHTFENMSRQLMRDIDDYLAELDGQPPQLPRRTPPPCVCGPDGIYEHAPFCSGPRPNVHPG